MEKWASQNCFQKFRTFPGKTFLKFFNYNFSQADLSLKKHVLEIFHGKVSFRKPFPAKIWVRFCQQFLDPPWNSILLENLTLESWLLKIFPAMIRVQICQLLLGLPGSFFKIFPVSMMDQYSCLWWFGLDV